MKRDRTPGHLILLLAAVVAALVAPSDGAWAGVSCSATVTANVVVFDTPIMFNRLGAQNPNWITYALRRDVVNIATGLPLTANGAAATPGGVAMRKDKRVRPLVLRVNEGECLQVSFQNLLAPLANPFVVADTEPPMNPAPILQIDDQVAGRYAGFHVRGLQLVGSIASDASNTGRNGSSLVPPGGSTTYTYYAPPGSRGTYLADSYGATFGGEATAGNTGQGMFAGVNVEPAGAQWYRSQVTEEEMRLATTGTVPAANGNLGGQPIINYAAVYPPNEPWISEAKAGLPILNIRTPGNEIVHGDLNAIIAGSNDGPFPASTYPLEKVGKRNPAVPNRLEAFREFTVIFHDEASVGQAFPGFFNANLVTARILHGVRDTFMINYGSGGVGAEIIANRLGVGPMHDCLTCSYEEFFLASSAVGDPAMLVDMPANMGLENCDIGGNPNACAVVGPKATKAFFPDDPSNVHHSYQHDRVVFRNLHAGKEHHIFHLHNHQWLFDSNDDNANYLDAQAIGPGSGYTYEINYGGAGNRNISAGDAIFHCHFYPHFAQGMWELWRIHDTFETGTPLNVSGGPSSFHTAVFGLFDGTPAVHPAAGVVDSGIPADARMRSLPDGEILVGTPIPALVPLPGKALAVMPGEVVVVQKNANPGQDDDPTTPAVEDGFDSSQAHVVNRTVNPGFPFWIAGVDCGGDAGVCPQGVVGQRGPTPPLDMLTEGQAQQLRTESSALFGKLNNLGGGATPNANGGWDGGLPRHALDGFRAVQGTTAARLDPTIVHQEQGKFSFHKEIHKAKPVWFPEGGTDLERVAMAFHAQPSHPSTAVTLDGSTAAANYLTNGGFPQAGAPFFEPCRDDKGKTLFAGAGAGEWWGREFGRYVDLGTSPFNADTPRVYKGANIQIDAVFNKLGYHYSQQRIIALWEDVLPTINKTKAPEVFVIRNNTLDCTRFLHTNLVPNRFEVDDYQVTTPTDIIGQHIHLPKWDLPSADGSGNGWNYEDGTLSPGSVRERIIAINHYNPTGEGNPANSAGANGPLVPLAHPRFGNGNNNEWAGARTTIQRWMFDPVLNVAEKDRGLGIIFTHDHYGPSTVQQVGLYASVLVEPIGSRWAHNETGAAMYTRTDGGPTSWQAAILPGTNASLPAQFEPFREFWFQHSDFQHAYEAGVYVGAGPDGRPNGVLPDANTFRAAVNPSVRQQASPVFPNVVRHPANCLDGTLRPCPEAISADDPGFLVVNYRNEPVGWRVFDPNKIGPDGKRGSQADGLAGDLAFALQSRADRKVPQFNTRLGNTPYPALNGDISNGDPFTPMMRAFAGDLIRIKTQAGGDEEEHNFGIHGVKWLQGGSSHGRAPNSGWRAAQMRGISEQFTFAAPIVPFVASAGNRADYAYSANTSQDGWWSGMWGILRTYNTNRTDLFRLPTTIAPVAVRNGSTFNGVCPRTATVRRYDLTAVLANDILGTPLGPPEGVTVPGNQPLGPRALGFFANDNEGGLLNPDGGSLLYNPRPTTLNPPVDDAGNPLPGREVKQGPLHDPTALMYVRTADLVFGPGTKTALGNPIGLRANAPVEPVVIRATAGECVEVTLRNALLNQAVDAQNRPVVDGNGQPVFVNLGQALFVVVNGIRVAAAQPVVFDLPPDLAGLLQLMTIVPRDKNDGPDRGVTWFGNNLIRPSSYVGLTPQLVALDVTQNDGTVVGINVPGNSVVAPGGSKTYRWYAGDLTPRRVGGNRADLVASPIEFGGANLMPADKIKQGQKGLVGALVIGPQGATIAETDRTLDHQQTDQTVTRETRASATFNGTIRDFALVFQKGLNLRYKDGTAVEQLAAEGGGVPEDSGDAGQMAMNYGTEPMWFRFGLQPDAPFGNTPGGFGAVANPENAYSNTLIGGDPATPIFTAAPGAPVRLHVLNPTGVMRGSVFHLHGHMWQRSPYVCPGQDDGLGAGMAGKCNWTDFGAANFEIGSRAIGVNPIGKYLGAQESILPAAHFDIVLPGDGLGPTGGAGGVHKVPGDYLFRDQGSFGNTQGLWGILRVE